MTLMPARSKLHIAITVAVMLFIFIQSALPGEISGAESNVLVRLLHDLTGADPMQLAFAVRKTAHFTEYLLLGLCLTVNVSDFLRARHAKAPLRFFPIPWLIGTAYAVTDEIHQAFVPDRACAVMDVCIDSAGVAVGVVIGMIVLHHLDRLT